MSSGKGSLRPADPTVLPTTRHPAEILGLWGNRLAQPNPGPSFSSSEVPLMLLYRSTLLCGLIVAVLAVTCAPDDAKADQPKKGKDKSSKQTQPQPGQTA